MGVDDLLLGLTHHWSRDTSVFPTEDDRLDVPTIMLFQAYTACRPAELVDGTKSRGGKDPLLDKPEDRHADAIMLDASPRTDVDTGHPILEQDRKDESDSDSDYDSESEVGDALFDDADDYDSDATSDTCSSIGDSENGSDDECLDNGSADESSMTDGGEPIRKHKALCYEDIILWIVKDPKQGGRDVWAMEVHFRHHKGADNKPKPYVIPVKY